MGVVANFVRSETVPLEIMLLVFGSLIAIGIGNGIKNPSASPVILVEHEETRFRRSQYIVSFVFSLILGLLLMLTDLREYALAYLLAPIIVMPFVLLLQDVFIGGKRVPVLLLPATELVVVCALLLSLAFYDRNHFEVGSPRHDFARLLFFTCVFGGAFIVEARLNALLRKRRVFIDENSCSRERWRARFYITGYVILVLSVFLLVVTMSL